MKKVVITLFALLLVSLFSMFSLAEVDCSPSSVSVSYTQGESINRTVHCSNDGNSSVDITKSGDFQIDESIIGPSPSSKDIDITFNPGADLGFNSGKIQFSDGSDDVLVFFYVEEEEEEPAEGCRLIELPHTTSYRIKQGETSTSGPIRIKVSSECPSSLNMAVTEQTQMSKPMYLQGQSGDVNPGDEFSFSIGLDAKDTSTGTYQNSYTISGTLGDEIYQKKITLFTIVVISDSPITNQTFSSLPTCTVDSDMQLNKTYSLICNNENPNIDIDVPYNEFFRGISVSEASGKFEYKFKPRKVGVTDFLVFFEYKGVSIGEAFEKEVRIMAGSVPVQGTEIEVNFYQFGKKKSIGDLVSGEVNILVKDENTDNIISDFDVYLNGELKNNSFILENEEYELIVHAFGYQSKTLNLTVKQSQLIVIINPDKSFYLVGDAVRFSSNVNGTSFLIDNTIVNENYTFTSTGEKVLKAVKSGHISAERNVTVKSLVSLSSCSPVTTKWKKGTNVVCDLSQNASFKVYSNSTLVSSGTGKRVSFEISEAGNLEIIADDTSIWSQKIEKKDYLYFLKFWSWEIHWFWKVVIGVVIVVIVVWIFVKGRETEAPYEEKISDFEGG